MIRVTVKPKVLNWALNRAGLSKEVLREKFPKIDSWFDGTEQPTLNQLEQFAKNTSTPFGYLMLQEPVIEDISIPFFRSNNDDSTKRLSTELIDTIHAMQRRQAWLAEYLKEENYEKLSFVKSAADSQNIIDIVTKIRQALRLNKLWASGSKTWEDALKAFRDIIEEARIVIVTNGVVGNNTHRKLNVEEFRGFVLVDEYAPFIFVNGSDSKAAQMFTIAHELAHIFIGSSAIFDLRDMQPSNDQKEILCNKVAAELLVPTDELIIKWEKGTKGIYQKLAKYFKVSELVIARRAQDLGLININTFLDFYNDYQNSIVARINNSGGDFYPTTNYRVGRLFGNFVDRAVSENKLLYSEAYGLTGLYGKTYNEYISSIKERM